MWNVFKHIYNYIQVNDWAIIVSLYLEIAHFPVHPEITEIFKENNEFFFIPYNKASNGNVKMYLYFLLCN